MTRAATGPSRSKQRIYLDILSCFLWAVLTPLAILYSSDNLALRFLVGVPFLLFVPGYLLTSILWTRKGELSLVERIAYAIGLSIAMAAILGLALSAFTAFNLLWLLISISTMSIAFGLVGYLRRWRTPADARIDAGASSLKIALTSGGKGGAVSILSVSIISIIIITMVVASFQPQRNVPDTTQFYLLDSNKKAIDYPVNVTAGMPTILWVGLHNGEGRAIVYTILVECVNLSDNSSVAVSNYSGSLVDGGNLENQVNATYPRPGDYLLRATLTIEGVQAPYATLHVNVRART